MYPVTGGLLSGGVGGVRVTVIDRGSHGGHTTRYRGGAGWGERVKDINTAVGRMMDTSY